MRLPLTRRTLLGVLGSAVFALLGWRRPQRRVQDAHPAPRPGSDASRVLPASRLEEHPDAVPVFDMVREMPQVIDGIRCQCGCAALAGKYSLLSCFEDDGMARRCEGCRAQVRLAYRLHRAGKSLDEIRAAIDEEFG
jgi:hypothetical protein